MGLAAEPLDELSWDIFDRQSGLDLGHIQSVWEDNRETADSI